MDQASGARRQVGVFAVVGAVCAAANFGVGAATRAAVPLGTDWPSVSAGFLAGAILSFYLNRRFTFEVHDADVGPQAVRFAVFSVVAVALSAVVAKVLEWSLTVVPVVPPESALAGNLVHIGTIGILFVFNFFAMKYFALARTA